MRALAYAASTAARGDLPEPGREPVRGHRHQRFPGAGGQLVTPPLSAGCLAGVTRALVIEWSGAVEEDLPLFALAGGGRGVPDRDVAGVQPIRAVDGPELPAVPGPVTAKAVEVFAMWGAESSDPQ